MKNILQFCREVLRLGMTNDYRAKRFTDPKRGLSALLSSASGVYKTQLGNFSETVDVNNHGETAFQRAIYQSSETRLSCTDREESVSWKDMELPVIFSSSSRRPSIDLIGHTRTYGTFLCELKYAKVGSAPAGNSVDYAIFEALLYEAIVQRDHSTLDEAKVYHQNGRGFRWKDVAASKTIMVAANCSFWTKAHCRSCKIKDLVRSIHDSTEVKVLLFRTPDYSTFCREPVREGRYVPELIVAEDTPNQWEQVF